jgi:hypothetical protein
MMTREGGLAERLSSQDPAVGLRAVAELRALLESVEKVHVTNARAQRWSWQQIATALGVSKQAVQRKWGSEPASGRPS